MSNEELIKATQWPERVEEATADALILHGARLTMAMIAANGPAMDKAFSTDRESPEYKPAMRAYIDGVTAFIAEAQVTVALVEVQKASREQADALARYIYEATEDGGALHELMWQFLDERGLDADAVWEAAEANARGATDYEDRAKPVNEALGLIDQTMYANEETRGHWTNREVMDLLLEVRAQLVPVQAAERSGSVG